MRSRDRNHEERVREALNSLDPVSMTEAERSDLRRAVWSEITASHSSAPAPRRAPWGWRVVGAAAALAVVVGAGATLMDGGASGGGDALSAEDTVFDALGRSTTTAAANFAAESTGDGAAPQTPESGEGDGGEDGEPILLAPETEVVLRRYAEMLRNAAPYRAALEESSCPAVDELEGLEPAALVDAEGVEYEAWIPAGKTLADDPPITFVDSESCAVAATE